MQHGTPSTTTHTAQPTGHTSSTPATQQILESVDRFRGRMTGLTPTFHRSFIHMFATPRSDLKRAALTAQASRVRPMPWTFAAENSSGLPRAVPLGRAAAEHTFLGRQDGGRLQGLGPHIYIYIYIYMYVCVCVCVHVYVYDYMMYTMCIMYTVYTMKSMYIMYIMYI